jgi:uncharacterized protein (DUF488 family)
MTDATAEARLVGTFTAMPLHTVGHGTLPDAAFGTLVRDAGLQQVVDVRAYPGSRHNPQYAREAMERWLPDADLSYEWIRQLGGRRRPQATSRHTALRNDAFRAYADHMETDDFRHGVEELVDGTELDQTVVMCSESVWWRCHRRLLADHLVLVRGLDVVHLMHDGRRMQHVVTEGARRADHQVVYDVGKTATLDLPAT